MNLTQFFQFTFKASTVPMSFGLSIKTIIYILSLYVTMLFNVNIVTARIILKRIPLKSEISRQYVNPRAIGVNLTTNRIYVGNGDSTVSVIDGKTNSRKDTVKIKNISNFHLRGLGVNTITNRIYIAGLGGTVDVINGKNNKIIDTIIVWEGSDGAKSIFPPTSTAEGVAVNSITNYIYVTHSGNIVSVIDGENNQVIDTIILRNIENVQGVELNALTNRIYVTGSALSVID
ncbi:MAG: hypothetical protein HQ521_03585, partial [Bacteroidetes bacterium]|nr:hypothetical protein [Bacteroidota bacterium]